MIKYFYHNETQEHCGLLKPNCFSLFLDHVLKVDLNSLQVRWNQTQKDTLKSLLSSVYIVWLSHRGIT